MDYNFPISFQNRRACFCYFVLFLSFSFWWYSLFCVCCFSCPPRPAESNANVLVQPSPEKSDHQSISLNNKPDIIHRPKAQACKVCGKVLSSASSYYVHMKLHSGSKPFHCTVCEASFCRKPYLEVHMRTHTGERPFQCDLCLKRFTQKSSLNTHKRVHTGERPYSCEICNKRFAVKSYVTAHRWSHVAEKPLNCERCSLTFSSKNQFAIHIKTHSSSANYECHICRRTFVRDSYLIRHLNRVHREANSNYPSGCGLRYFSSQDLNGHIDQLKNFSDLIDGLASVKLEKLSNSSFKTSLTDSFLISLL